MTEVRVGAHPSNNTLFALSELGYLEEMLEPEGTAVEWVRYREGTKTVEMLASGEIDLGGTGSTPPILAQGRGVDVVYVATSPPRPAHGALVVKDASPIRAVEDLAGRSVALSEGSFQQHLLAVALDNAGLGYNEVRTVDLRAKEGREAFASGAVDAWVGGDPELSAEESTNGVRRLVETSDVISNRSVWFARRAFAETEPETLDTIVGALGRANGWIADNPRRAAELFAGKVEGSPGVSAWEAALSRRPWETVAISDEFLAEQQRAADLFFGLGIIPRQIDTRDASLDWTPEALASPDQPKKGVR